MRLGGESFEQWAEMKTTALIKEIQAIMSLAQQQKENKEQLCDTLFTFIEQLDDAAHQNVIQNLRRDLFNSRKAKNNNLNKAKRILTAGLNNQLDNYLKLISDLSLRISSAEAVYQNTLFQNRTTLKKMVNNDSLKKGLLLSSKSLLERLDSFKNKDVADFRKKEFQVEQGLLKYLTRMYTKTSPFSTFTNLSMAELNEGNKTSPIAIKHSTEEKVKGHIRLNNYLFKYLLDLFKNYRQAYLWFYLRPNPTVENKNDHFLFLTNHNNIESFQRIPFSPVVELIIETTRESKSGIRFNQLITTLQQSIEADASELEAYIKQLIDYGCLEYNIGVSGIDPDWDKKLIEQLAPLKNNSVPHISDLVDVLIQLREMGNRYADEGGKGRKEILNEAYDKFRSICMVIHKEAGLPEEERKTKAELQAEWQEKQEELKNKKKEDKRGEKENPDEAKEEETFTHQLSTFFSFKPEQIFYEDTTREANIILNKAKMEEFVSKLDGLLQSLRLFKGMVDEKHKMSYYFLKKYKKDSEVNLLTFYEDYFKEYKKPLQEFNEIQKKEAQEKAKKQTNDYQDKSTEIKKVDNPFLDIPALTEKKQIIELWNEKYVNAVKTNHQSKNGQVNISYKELESTNFSLGIDNKKSDGVSYGTFVQFYTDNRGALKGVLNGTFAGYGKMLSRFLHIFDQKVTDDLRAWNEKSNMHDGLFIEDCDASYFNANLHPPLMPNEIWMPGGHNTLPEEKQLAITDFKVIYDETEENLILKYKPNGKISHVFDLGFQGSRGRSQLFQLLDKFSKAELLFTYPVTNAVNTFALRKENKAEGKEPEISMLPRVVYEGQIILQRKTWNTPKTCIPEKLPSDSDWQYYLKINQWRMEMDIPDEVFVFVIPDRWSKNDPKLAKKVTKDDYKPQYIDFRNPLLINLLEKLIAKASVSIKIQEMLPDSGQMLKIDNERFVSEFVVQWYN